MKICPKCKRSYTDDLFFCLDDGTSLAGVNIVDPTARTEVAIDVDQARPTEVIPQVITAEIKPKKNYAMLVAGVLAVVCAMLFGALVVVYFGLTPRDEKAVANTASLAPTASPTPAVAPSTINVVTPAANTNTKQTSTTTTTVLDPGGRWKGEWSTVSGTLFDFELTLDADPAGTLDGRIKWTMRRTARPDKTDKIGLSATEFVRGTFDPQTGKVQMSGYRKDDPDSVLVMLDAYKLDLSTDGRSLTGLARNGGKWNGHIKLAKQ